LSEYENLHIPNGKVKYNLESVVEDILLLKEAFETHSLPFSANETYEENPQNHHIGNETAVVEIQFKGWFQMRMATDPDYSHNRRGVHGNVFATAGEPDLDKDIRFKNPLSPRRFSPPVGVKVYKANRYEDWGSIEFKEMPQLVGSTIDLLQKPNMVCNNYLVATDVFPIDPFHIEITTPEGAIISREVFWSGRFKEMTPQQRIGTHREITYLNQDDTLLRKNLELVGQRSAKNFYEDRMALLMEARQKATTDEEISHFDFRIKDLNLTWYVNPQGGTDIRYRRLQWGTYWKHTISGNMTISETKAKLPFVPIVGDRDHNRWIVGYYMGFYDSDAQVGFVDGSLVIPVQ